MASDTIIGAGLAPSPYQVLLDENANLKAEVIALHQLISILNIELENEGLNSITKDKLETEYWKNYVDKSKYD